MSDAVYWLILPAYLIGWLIRIPFAMRRRMSSNVCRKCGNDEFNHDTESVRHMCRQPSYEPRGAIRERTGKDVAIAVVSAAFWLPLLLILSCKALVVAFGVGVRQAVFRVTPLTQPELERRIREQKDEIDRLTARIQNEVTP